MQWQLYSQPRQIKRCAGVVVIACSTRRVLLLQRPDNGLWENPGGHVETGESYREAALRELAEETGYDGPMAVAPTSVSTGTVRVHYECFLGVVQCEFEPVLTEHVAYQWVERDRLPAQTLRGTRKALSYL